MKPPKIKTFNLANKLIGLEVPPTIHGHAGRAVEDYLELLGVPINRGHGADILMYGLELKTRDVDAISAQTIADMSLEEILNTDYQQSHVWKKFQQQLRIKISHGTIIEAAVYDFSAAHIQDLIEKAYNNAKKCLQKNNHIDYTPYVGFYGYFERGQRKTYSFRLNSKDMKTLERMSKSNYQALFQED